MDQTKIDISHQPQTAHEFGVSYFLALDVPQNVSDAIEDRMQSIAREIGDGFYVQPASSLHVTVLDFVDAIIDPQKFGFASKAEVWAKIGPQCQAAVERALKNVQPFTVTFNELQVGEAAVILLGHDGGQLEQIRRSIHQEIGELQLPRTKQPPQIIHLSVARYTKVMPLQPVRELAAAEPLEFKLEVNALHLRNQLKINMLEYTDLQVYDLEK